MYGFAAVDLIYVCAFFIGFCHFHARTRRRMMLMKLVACCLTGVYFHLIDADTAMMASVIAGMGALFQACFNEDMLAKTVKLRIGFAVSLAVSSIAICASNSLEALPLVATINARLCEVQSSQQRIRIGYLMSSVCWIVYGVSSGLILIYVTENLNMLSNMAAIWKEEQKRKKSVPIPVRAA